MNRGKDALPSNAAFLLQCPYLVNSSKLTAWDHREQEKRSSSPQKPQRKTPEMPQTFHTWQVPSSADAGGANASEPYGWFVRTSSVKIQRIKWIDNESDSHLGRFFQKDGNWARPPWNLKCQWPWKHDEGEVGGGDHFTESEVFCQVRIYLYHTSVVVECYISRPCLHCVRLTVPVRSFDGGTVSRQPIKQQSSLQNLLRRARMGLDFWFSL